MRSEEAAEVQQTTATAVAAEPLKGLAPWRTLVTPHPDVASGNFRQAEFAADLAQVARGEGAKEYIDPREFFSRTYLTEGLRLLLTGALRRLSGTGGESVIDLQTTFGGGKTHSMLALWHLADPAVPIASLPGLEGVLTDAKVTTPAEGHPRGDRRDRAVADHAADGRWDRDPDAVGRARLAARGRRRRSRQSRRPTDKASRPGPMRSGRCSRPTLRSWSSSTNG